MARPQKEGLDYFPHDVDMDQDDKVIMVTAKYGMEGYGILNKIMQQIYKERGYYMDWEERERHVFRNRVNVDINTLDGVINECLEWGFFSKEKYEHYHILTSAGFQKRYIEATKRRKVVTMKSEYILVDINDMIEQFKTPLKLVNADKNGVNVNINSVIDNIGRTESTQSKVKEIKELKPIVEQHDNSRKKEAPAYAEAICSVISYLNEQAEKNFSPQTKETVKLLGARLKAGATIEQCKSVIDVKVNQWKGDVKMDRCLKPGTLFAESNFESYLNEVNSKTTIFKGVGRLPYERESQSSRLELVKATDSEREEFEAMYERLAKQHH